MRRLFQAMLEGSKQNRNIFNKIARKMEAAGYKKTANKKLENKKIKDTRNKTGRGI